MAQIHKFGLANSLLDSPMATWLTLTGTLSVLRDDHKKYASRSALSMAKGYSLHQSMPRHLPRKSIMFPQILANTVLF